MSEDNNYKTRQKLMMIGSQMESNARVGGVSQLSAEAYLIKEAALKYPGDCYWELVSALEKVWDMLQARLIRENQLIEQKNKVLADIEEKKKQ
jgi:hypothetical protein